MFDVEGIQRSCQELKKFFNIETRTLENLFFNEVGKEKIPYDEGDYFGKKNHYYEITGEMTVPDSWRHQPLCLEIYSSKNEWDNTTNPQMKLYLDKKLIQGIDVNHQEIYLPHWVAEKGTVAFHLTIFSGREEKKYPIYIRLHRMDEKVRKTFYDLFVPLKSCMSLEKGSESYLALFSVLDEAVKKLDYRTPFSAEFYRGLEACQSYLQEHLYQKYPLSDERPSVWAVGHSHIDIAWLWTVRQAIEKGERSFATVLKLMEEDPNYHFIQSQPQLYAFIKDHYPELYEKIKAQVAKGKWEPEGAMWVEADCNLTSGESLVRQILYGKLFFKEEFGQDNQVLWLPDVFGYSAALPQILKKSGTPYFMTTKLSWNQFNQIPYDTFYWQGIDGSVVLTHFITTTSGSYQPTSFYTTYNGLLDPPSILGSWERYEQKELNNEVLVAYGYGDGGGGPTRQMLEVGKRMQQPLPGMPNVTFGKARTFFERLDRRMKGKEVPRWMGELYFEYHRGTYTSMAKNKKSNRQAEFLLQSLEKLYAQLDLNYYPKESLERLWKLVLLNQFHDILPGTAIKEVYDQTDLEYQEVFEQGKALLEKGLTLLTAQHKGETKALVLFNPLGIKRDRLVEIELPAGFSLMDGNEVVPVQKTNSGNYVAQINEIPSLGYKLLTLKPQVETDQVRDLTLETEIDTPFYIIQFNKAYEIVSIFDKKAQREVIPNGKTSNQLVAYEDLPMGYDAWDIDIYYKKKPWLVNQLTSARLIEDGPLRKTVEIIRQFDRSTIKQHLYFYTHSPRIDFETWINWQQEHVLLKVNFPVAVNSLKATFDIQFGNVQRPLHKNTSWDVARFEVCGQKWVDLSEGNYGLSVITDSKYGYDVDYQKIGLTLIKSATDPNPVADQGEHHFTYALYPHEGTWKEAGTVAQAFDLNVPVYQSSCLVDAAFSSEPWVSCDVDNVVIDTVKQAEARDGLIVRLYEDQNKTTTAVLSFKELPQVAYLCDLLENTLTSVPIKDHQVQVPFSPFEIQTLKIQF